MKYERRTRSTAATLYMPKAKIVPSIMCELGILFLPSIVCNFLLKCIKRITVLLGHIKTMEPSRCELLVRFNKFFEKSTFKKVLGLGNKKHLLNDFLHALNIASAFCRYFVSLLVTRLICMIV